MTDPSPPPPRMLRRDGAFVAHDAVVRGDIALGIDTSVWYGCVVRGDCARITIGDVTNVQDLTMVHADTGVPQAIGSYVTVGHKAVLHGRVVGDRCLIGIGAIVLGGAEIGDECIIGAGALVTENQVVPPRSLVLGMPGKVVRTLGDEEVAGLVHHAEHYRELARGHLDGPEEA